MQEKKNFERKRERNNLVLKERIKGIIGDCVYVKTMHRIKERIKKL